MEVAAPRFSFVIAVYNVEGYIRRCLDSILSQPFESFEVLVVDDGSTDGTPRILTDYAEADPRVRILRQENSGQGAARSRGLDAAVGEYVWCVDGDDWIAPQSLPRIDRILDQHRPDVVVLNFAHAFEDGRIGDGARLPGGIARRVIDAKQDEHTFSALSCWSTPPWRFVARRCLTDEAQIRFPEGVFYEDHPFAISLMAEASRVYVDDETSYFYFQRSGSTVHVNDRKIFDFLPVRRECIGLLHKYGLFHRFQNIACSYVMPTAFFQHHVPEEYRQAFLESLREDLTTEERDFVELNGNNDEKQLLAAVFAPLNGSHRESGLEVTKDAGASQALRCDLHRLPVAMRSMALSPVKRILRWGLRRYGPRLVSFMRANLPQHETAAPQDRRLRLGPGSLAHMVTIDVRVAPEDRTYVQVGRDSQVSGYFVFERGIGRITVGDRSSIGHGCMFVCAQEEGIRIGNNVMISWNCTLIDNNAHSLNPEVRANDAYDWLRGVRTGKIGKFKDWTDVRSAPIVIEDQAWIGFGSSILKGVTIGKGAVVGSNSVVTKSIPPYTIFAGNPARFVGFATREHWTWDEIVAAAQAAPEFKGILTDAYIDRDVVGSFERFIATKEWMETCDLVERHASKPLGRVLDIGGGNGITALAFAIRGHQVTLVEKSESPIVGTDAAKRLFEYARTRYPDAVDRIRIVNGFVEDAPLPEKFDIAYCRQVVHHFRKPSEVMRKIFDLLSDGGIFLATREHVVFDEEDKSTFLASHPFHKFYKGENAYKLEEYQSFFESAGFSLEKIYSFFETHINFSPRSPEDLEGLTERHIAGRPYSFLARKVGAGS